ncbi:MAG: hypothetical protein EU552_01350 [Promethearchaeota archaeon]|nr:MAG: hypothetical protein EU552_01350 [Candidatus Lokiarchaeota archaeon]
MAQEIIIIWLPESTQAVKVENVLRQSLNISSKDLQLITLQNKKDKKKLKKKLKREVLKLAGSYAHFHKNLIDPREISHSYGFYNYLLKY